jgi:thioredoxin
MNIITETNATSFSTAVLQAPVPVLVDFHAAWCPPCRIMQPALEQLAEEFAGRLKVVRVDAEDDQELADSYRVESIPTLVLFRHGQPQTRKVGLASLSDLRAMIEEFLVG